MLHTYIRKIQCGLFHLQSVLVCLLNRCRAGSLQRQGYNYAQADLYQSREYEQKCIVSGTQTAVGKKLPVQQKEASEGKGLMSYESLAEHH